MLREEVVTRRKWVTEQRFLDLLGATNLIPGPNSTEMAIHIGYERRGWHGLVIAGTSFILPSSILVGIIAWAYVEFKELPTLQWMMYGIKPVVIAILLNALFGLGSIAFKSWKLVGLGVLGLGFFWAGVNELIVLFGGGLAIAITRLPGITGRGGWSLPGVFAPLAGAHTAIHMAAGTPSLNSIFITFAKLGAVIYGSGYVLLPFMNNELVERLDWLTSQELLDGIAIGQVTPGPVFTTATFVGYLIAGIPGAAIATVAIFLPSFLFVSALNPLIHKIRDLDWTAGFLDGVNASAIALMAGAVIQLRSSAILDSPTTIITIASLIALRLHVNATYIVCVAAVAGTIKHLLVSQ